MIKSKVAVIKCNSYDTDNIKNQINRGLNLLGGIESFVDKSEKILLKPNILNKALPEKAVTTHPSILESVIQILKDNDCRHITYGDSPGNPSSPEKIAETCGLKAVGDKYGITFGDFSHGQTVNFSEGNITKQFEISNGTLNANSIINLCKMKTHGLMRITGAVKNMLGCVYGFNKGMSHAKFSNPDDFGKMLVDLSLLLKPKLHIMDGVIAMEGNGPLGGTPTPMNVILLSSDPVALDTVFCKLINVNPETVPTIKYGELFGLGKSKNEDIEIVGDSIEELINTTFDVFRGTLDMSKWSILTKLRAPFTRKPVLNEKKCTKCGACVEACPIKKDKAIFFKEATNPPVFNYKNCIRCYCCQEMCTFNAIDVKTPLLGKFFIYRLKKS